MNMTAIKELRRVADTGEAMAPDTALEVLRAGGEHLPQIMAAAWAVRVRGFGRTVSLCSILNAKSGACGEDCAFCAQSVHHHTGAEVYDLRRAEEIGAAYRKAAEVPVRRFGVVTSGGDVGAQGVATIGRAIRETEPTTVEWCASLGTLAPEQLRELKAAGLRRFHHNLETAASFFPRICTTHRYEDRLATLRAVKREGLEICSGGILGMGETPEQRVEFAATLAAEGVDAIPLNFLVPIRGTPLEHRRPMAPLEILKAVAMFRLMNPRAELLICGGRVHLRDLQALIFYAGATGMMIGPLLTVPGRNIEQDLQMLRDLELDTGRG